MNRREFLTGAATAAASLFVPRVNPEPKYTDEDVERIVGENEKLQTSLELARVGSGKAYHILQDISWHLLGHGFPWAFYWRDLADQVEALCYERDRLQDLLDIWNEHHQEMLKMWEQRCAELEKEAAFYHSL